MIELEVAETLIDLRLNRIEEILKTNLTPTEKNIIMEYKQDLNIIKDRLNKYQDKNGHFIKRFLNKQSVKIKLVKLIVSLHRKYKDRNPLLDAIEKEAR